MNSFQRLLYEITGRPPDEQPTLEEQKKILEEEKRREDAEQADKAEQEALEEERQKFGIDIPDI